MPYFFYFVVRFAPLVIVVCIHYDHHFLFIFISKQLHFMDKEQFNKIVFSALSP